jgi:hypothetical protein
MNSQADEPQKQATSIRTMGIGIVLGFPMGLALGIAFGNIAIGIPVGIAIGLGLGSAFEKSKRPLTEREKRNRLFVQIFGILLFVAGVVLIFSYFLR